MNWEVGPPQTTESDSILILNFSDSRTIRNKFLLFITHLVFALLLKQPELANTYGKIFHIIS